MKQFNQKAIEIETTSTLQTIHQANFLYPAYIGLDTHKDTIAVSGGKGEKKWSVTNANDYRLSPTPFYFLRSLSSRP
jgi:hypothetical protein